MLHFKRIDSNDKTFHGMLEISYRAGDDTRPKILLTKQEEKQLKEYLNGKST